jgi:hypothetical protein
MRQKERLVKFWEHIEKLPGRNEYFEEGLL